MPNRRFWAFSVVLLAAVTAVYSNHFQNEFHFDDFHTVTQNPYIRSLKNLPLIFKSSEAFSVLPANRSYRPLVTATLAFDFWLGRGAKPFFFHLTTFIWYLTQLLAVLALFRRLLRLASDEPWTDYAALFAVAVYGLHPAMAETVNYVIQRGDLYSTLGVAAALAIYVLSPRHRASGVYLIPLALGLLCKPPAAIFPAILFAYVLLFEEWKNPRRLRVALSHCAPSLIVVAALMILTSKMTPATYNPGIVSPHDYIAAQPYVALHYFLMFFAPIALTADSDMTPQTSFFTAEGSAGILFLAALAWGIYASAKKRQTRPIAFGLAWFLLALIPTSVYRLSEVENDHRMFFPFVGLALAVTWVAALTLCNLAPRANPRVLATAAALILAACAFGAHQRNEAWRTEESLWRDVANKSPRNGRGLMNYGLTLMSKGKYPEALDYFQRALQFTPNYATLEINLGIVLGELHRDGDAEAHFHRAIQLAPDDAQTHFFYGRYLKTHGQISQAVSQFLTAIARNRDYLDPRDLLIETYTEQNAWAMAVSLAQDTLNIAPDDVLARSVLQRAATSPALLRNAASPAIPPEDPVSAAEKAAHAAPTADNYLNLSLAYHQAHRYEDCIRAAEEALKLRPGYAEAYNNLAAAYEDLHQWDKAIRAANEALRLKPDFQLARNNLNYSLSQKQAERARQ
jgi:tetratricopeptide (TPR) repeat protein